MDDVSLAPPLTRFNEAPAPQARVQLLACCSSQAWADRILVGRPYASVEDVLAASDAALAGLGAADVDEALAGHPRIGERPTAAHSGFSAAEQSGVAGADGEVLAELARANTEYERRFGHVYLVCAAGRSAAELLAVLRSRLSNDPATERAVLIRELAKINRLRLGRMLESSADR